MRWFVYDIRTQMEDFIASFADINDALRFGKEKFGSHAHITFNKMHERTNKVGRGKKIKR